MIHSKSHLEVFSIFAFSSYHVEHNEFTSRFVFHFIFVTPVSQSFDFTRPPSIRSPQFDLEKKCEFILIIYRSFYVEQKIWLLLTTHNNQKYLHKDSCCGRPIVCSCAYGQALALPLVCSRSFEYMISKNFPLTLKTQGCCSTKKHRRDSNNLKDELHFLTAFLKI